MFSDQIAYRKPVEVSKLNTTTDLSFGDPFRLTDQLLSLGAYSENMLNPWIRLDLEDLYFIREIIVIARASWEINDFALRIGMLL